MNACNTVALVALNENAFSTDAVIGHARPVGWPSPGRGCQASWAAVLGRQLRVAWPAKGHARPVKRYHLSFLNVLTDCTA